jgi:hypothetical protein
MAKGKDFYMFPMDSKEAREKSVRVLFDNAKEHKQPITKKFQELDEYYHNDHYTNEQLASIAAEKGWDFVPPVLTDPFIQVETQIDPLPPEFTFKGRDSKADPRMASVRQDVVKFILYNNRFLALMPNNERNLNKLGTAGWKVAFDGSVKGPGFIGDIVVGGPSPANIFPDPNAYCDDDCEFIDYAYRMHRNKAWRTFPKKEQREILSKLVGSANHGDTEIYTRPQDYWSQDDTFQIVEHWYMDWDGDMACSIQIENHEIQHIPKYWQRTRHYGNHMYPIITYRKIPDEKSFWGIGEIEMIQTLVDAGDRELLMAVLHDMYDADDMLVIEENALKDGTSIAKTPGGIIWAKDGKGTAIRRLGDMGSNINALNMINKFEEKIQETNGSFDSAQGKEPVRVTTSSGIAQLNERAGKRADIKKADRAEGFRRLYELCDWTALEFYTQDREILIRGEGQKPDRYFNFNSDNIRAFDKNRYSALLQSANEGGESIVPGYNDQEIAEQSFYYPRIDVEIVTTDGMKQSKAFQTQATTEVAQQLDNINPAKAELIKSNVELMGLPNEQAIKDAIDQTVAMQAGQMQPGGVHPVDQYYNSLSPEQQQEFAMLSQEEQIALVRQAMGGNV